MHSPRPSPPLLKRSVSSESQDSYHSAATTASRSSSKLLFGEIPLTPATTVDGRSTRSNSSICNLVLSTSSSFLRFWLNDSCRDSFLNHVDQEDLPNLRLVCHDFASRAAPVLFESITVSFRPSTFSKPARIEALSKVGKHVKTFTFHMPHGPETFLPPIVDPETGEEKQFLYEPQLQSPANPALREKTPKYGTWDMTNLLIQQYPPLFHAATNVPAFVAAFSELTHLTHLKVSCPGHGSAPRHRRSAVDYALISLRIAMERAPVFHLHSLSLHPIHPGGLLYLHPMHGFGSTPSSAKRWAQLRHLSICMESLPVPTTPKIRLQSLEHLRILHAYLRTLSHSVTSIFFRWKGARGPSPLSLDQEPCMIPVDETCMHPSQRGQVRGPRPLRFTRLRNMQLENAVMDSAQIADFIHKHRRTLVEFSFEDVKLRQGSWDDALEPLTRMVARGVERVKAAALKGSPSSSCQQQQQDLGSEIMEVPIMFSPTRSELKPTRTRAAPPVPEPRIMGPLMEQIDQAIDDHACLGGGGSSVGKVNDQRPSGPSHGHAHQHSLSRWLSSSKRGTTLLKKSAAQHASATAGAAVGAATGGCTGGAGEHVKRLLRLTAWK